MVSNSTTGTACAAFSTLPYYSKSAQKSKEVLPHIPEKFCIDCRKRAARPPQKKHERGKRHDACAVHDRKKRRDDPGTLP